MRKRIIAVLLYAVLVASVAFCTVQWSKSSAIERVPERSPQREKPMMARVGDSATGRVLEEKIGDHLDLDTSPCDEKDVIRFVTPYKKDVVGTLVCGNKAYEKYRVEQNK
jgi:hypothetical protein